MTNPPSLRQHRLHQAGPPSVFHTHTHPHPKPKTLNLKPLKPPLTRSCRSVQTTPGDSTLTRMPCGAKSRARARPSASMAPLTAAACVVLGPGLVALLPDTKVILPPRRMCGAAVWVSTAERQAQGKWLGGWEGFCGLRRGRRQHVQSWHVPGESIF